jgi:hypothetical protein
MRSIHPARACNVFTALGISCDFHLCQFVCALFALHTIIDA